VVSTLLLVFALIINVRITPNNYIINSSLSDIALMAKADGESYCEGRWHITYSGSIGGSISISCTLGGSYCCPLWQ
jgi:hypothetical protein